MTRFVSRALIVVVLQDFHILIILTTITYFRRNKPWFGSLCLSRFFLLYLALNAKTFNKWQDGLIRPVNRKTSWFEHHGDDCMLFWTLHATKWETHTKCGCRTAYFWQLYITCCPQVPYAAVNLLRLSLCPKHISEISADRLARK